MIKHQKKFDGTLCDPKKTSCKRPLPKQFQTVTKQEEKKFQPKKKKEKGPYEDFNKVTPVNDKNLILLDQQMFCSPAFK